MYRAAKSSKVAKASGLLPFGAEPSCTMKFLAMLFAAAAALLSFGYAPAAAVQAARTQVVVFKASSMKTTQSANGNCWTNSIASRRADAYRCMTKNSISDPCFVLAARSVACPSAMDPKTGIRINLDKPFPRPEGHSQRTAFMMKLAGGIVCNMGTGTVMPGYPFYCTGNWVCAAPNVSNAAAIFVSCGQPQTPTAVTAVGRYLVTNLYE